MKVLLFSDKLTDYDLKWSREEMGEETGDEDGNLDRDEIMRWMLPDHVQEAMEEAQHLLDITDQDGDEKLTYDEIFANSRSWMGSAATDHGQQMSDDYEFHEDL